MTDERTAEIYRRFAEALEAGEPAMLFDEAKQTVLFKSIANDVFIIGTSTDPRTPIGILSIK